MGIGDKQSAKTSQGRKETASCAVSIPMVEPEVGLSCHEATRLPCLLMTLIILTNIQKALSHTNGTHSAMVSFTVSV